MGERWYIMEKRYNKNCGYSHKRIKYIMASDKVQYIVALISEFADHYGISAREAADYLNKYQALDLYDRQYNYLHTQSFESNIRDLSAYCKRMGGSL